MPELTDVVHDDGIEESRVAVELRGISKRFGAVHANRGVDLVVQRGEIHGIVGENGAGKSTLMAILNGFQQADSGKVLLSGRQVVFRGSRDAIRLGVGTVHQHFMLVDNFTVLENVLLGAEGGLLLAGGAARVRNTLRRLEADYGLAVDPDAVVGGLSVGARQRVEILKALFRGAAVLVFDEPTGVLTSGEADDLFRVLHTLRAQGRTVLLITHKLREIMAVTDRVSVMRAGQMVAHRRTADTSAVELGELMIGHRPPLAAPKPTALPRNRSATPALEASALRVRDDSGVERVHNVDLAIQAGEILGIAGVAGNGQGELLEALAGMRRPESGRIRLRGEVVFPGASYDPAAARRRGLAHVPEDRLRTGLVPGASAADTAILGHHRDPGLRRFGLLGRDRIEGCAVRLMRDHDVRPPAPRLRSGLFSGGNQQKLVLGREIDRNPAVLLVGQPTRGVDIGGIESIHRRLLDCAARGMAVLLVSVELEEILRLADRIMVMFDGRIAGEFAAGEADERQLGSMMAGLAA